MGRPILADLDLGSAARILNLLDATDPQHPVTLAQLRAAIEGLAWKDSCRVSTQANVDLASPGASIDGVSLSAGDRVLVRAQTDDEDNGIYIWNGAATPMTRASDASTAAELENATVSIDEGTDAGTTWRQEEVNFTLDTDPVSFVSFGVSVPDASETTKGKVELATVAETTTGTDDTRAVHPAGLAGSVWAKKKHAADVGDGSSTSITVTHNFNTRDVVVMVRETSGNYRAVDCEVRVNNVNSVDLLFASAPGSGALRAIIIA